MLSCGAVRVQLELRPKDVPEFMVGGFLELRIYVVLRHHSESTSIQPCLYPAVRQSDVYRNME